MQEGTTARSIWRIIELVMYGMMPKENTET